MLLDCGKDDCGGSGGAWRWAWRKTVIVCWRFVHATTPAITPSRRRRRDEMRRARRRKRNEIALARRGTHRVVRVQFTTLAAQSTRLLLPATDVTRLPRSTQRSQLSLYICRWTPPSLLFNAPSIHLSSDDLTLRVADEYDSLQLKANEDRDHDMY